MNHAEKSGLAAEELIAIRDLNVFYGDNRAVKDVSLSVPERAICAMIGPSGCGKSTILKAIVRLFEDEHHTRPVRVTGTISFKGKDVYRLSQNEKRELRRKVVYIPQNPHVFDLSIYENIAIGLKYWKPGSSRSEIEMNVQRSLDATGLWNEVKGNLTKRATELSTGQQQRLCIARALALRPEVLLMDEPTANLDPISIQQIEGNIDNLKDDVSILIVTHNLQQAARVSDLATLVYLGELLETANTTQIFTSPIDPRTRDYITGRFG